MNKYAFWKYDLFPFVLGGPIKRFCPYSYPGKDYVETENYGQGNYFKPFAIVSLEKGKQIQDKLNNLENLCDDMIQAIEAQMKVKLAEIMKELGENK